MTPGRGAAEVSYVNFGSVDSLAYFVSCVRAFPRLRDNGVAWRVYSFIFWLLLPSTVDDGVSAAHAAHAARAAARVVRSQRQAYTAVVVPFLACKH